MNEKARKCFHFRSTRRIPKVYLRKSNDIMKRTKISFTILLFLHLAGFSQITNQRLFDTIGFIPEYYPHRIATFEKEPMAKGQIIFLGNSITEMGNWKKLTHDSAVLNRGISGDITFGVLKRLDEIIQRQPSKVFLLIGINDIGKDIPDTVIADNIGKIVTRIKLGSPGTKVYVESIMPVNPTIKNFPQHYDKQAHILHTNILIQKVAHRLDVPYINIHDLFTDKYGRLDAKYTAEGLHLTQSGGGYEKWIAYLRKLGYL
jgi:lysophospholipase L1-like esterase